MARARGKRLEQERRERARQREAAQRTESRRRALLWTVGLVLVALAGAAFLLTRPPGPGVQETETFADQGRAHLAPGSPTPEYNSNPPTSGPHGPVPAPCGIHAEPVADIAQVHSLEHGAVIIQYDPTLPAEDVESLRSLARDFGDWTMLAPREGMPAPIALTAWGNRLLLEEVDEAAIRTFHQRFARMGPENALCPFAVDQAGP